MAGIPLSDERECAMGVRVAAIPTTGGGLARSRGSVFFRPGAFYSELRL